MDDLIEKMRAATANDASDEARAAGAQACRTLLTALEAKPGESMATAVTVPTPVQEGSATPLATVQALAAALRGMTPDQLLDLAITRLRAALPAGAEAPTAQAVKFPLVPINR